ncbi:hypothetical protein FNV43_RR24706 [Rhamnella rubrinervis]|uniref:Uncharacterized protein n=1 Tax=Rhamnella rubrinervis TaxID=2594499 RepID=A0A8K0DST0_9ROSA|nr:hypothetical protein FNV43_RR24706 [Rhamnella rubrinervis]
MNHHTHISSITLTTNTTMFLVLSTRFFSSKVRESTLAATPSQRFLHHGDLQMLGFVEVCKSVNLLRSLIISLLDVAERKNKIVSSHTHNEPYKVKGTQPHNHSFSFLTCKVTYGGVDRAYYTSSRTRRAGGDGVVVEETKEARIRQLVKQHINSQEEFTTRVSQYSELSWMHNVTPKISQVNHLARAVHV